MGREYKYAGSTLRGRGGAVKHVSANDLGPGRKPGTARKATVSLEDNLAEAQQGLEETSYTASRGTLMKASGCNRPSLQRMAGRQLQLSRLANGDMRRVARTDAEKRLAARA